MALTKELLGVLENSEEPLHKRLQIANNAFKSIELPIQRREAVLLRWLGKTIKSNDGEVWNLLLSWLTSQQIQDLSRNDISQEDIKYLMNVIIKRSKHCDNLDTVINCASAIIENINFQLFFKYDLETYCNFISKILLKMESEEQVYNFIKSERLFSRNIISTEEFSKYFLENTLNCLACIVEKFHDNETIFQEITKIVERCLFHRNYKNFLEFLQVLTEADASTDQTLSQLPRLLLKKLKSLSDNNETNTCYIYKLIFYSYCASYSNDFQIIYKFFIVLLQTLGFDMASYYKLDKLNKYNNKCAKLNHSIMVLRELCDVIKATIDINAKLNEITFSDLIKTLTLTIISLTKQPNENIYKFLNCVIVLNPLIVEKILNEILVYVMLSQREDTKVQYVKFAISLFEVFSKLHRIPNLISKMIPTIKAALEGNVNVSTAILSTSGSYEEENKTQTNLVAQEMMPGDVLSYFTQCITTLPSWQVMNLFKTFQFHLAEAVEKDLLNADESKIIYIEMIAILMCQFLCSVRIAEHTVPTVMVEKFVKSMEELKDILTKFGSALVKMEHNPPLMRTYLNLCYSWGELYIILAYYSTNNEVVLQKTLDGDSSACNITYLHPYLSRDQWCLISQRIANFGERPCKQIMHKLYIQKLKALLLFEESINEEMISSIRSSILSAINDNWKDVLFDQLVLDQIISKSNSLFHIAEIILQDIIKTNNYDQLNAFFNCKELINAILYMCLYKLNKAFKRKQKKGQPEIRISLSSKLFACITEDLFLNQNEDLQPILDSFSKELKLEMGRSSSNKEIISVINEKDLSDYMDVIKKIPVIQYDNTNFQQILIMHLICVRLDLGYSTVQNEELMAKCESIVIGLIQNCNTSLKFLIAPFDSMKIIINKFLRHLEIFTLTIQNVLRNEDNLELLRDAIRFLAENIEQERYLSCVTEILNAIAKHKKSKASSKDLMMEYQEELCRHISEFIKTENCDIKQLVEPYALTLKHNLSKNSNEDSLKLLPFLEKCMEEILTNQTTKGGVLLFTTILRNKSKLKITNDDIVTKAWRYCQNCNVDDKEQDEYSKLVMLIFELIPNEQFSDVANDLLQSTTKTIENNDVQKFVTQLKIWSAILYCNFNPTKTKLWQNILESLLLDTLMSYLKNNEDVYEDITKFQISIIQNVHLLLTSSLVEAILISVSTIIERGSCENFPKHFTLCVSLLENLLKFRKPILMDYIPSYLQRYRSLLNKLCIKSNSDLKLEPLEVQHVSDCAHKFEKLTKSLINCQRHLMRICPYLIADILKQYEEITLFPNVKIHLNNCLYSLLSLCDQHAISYLMRILSTASTEMFKVTYDNYKKYYKFTGKV